MFVCLSVCLSVRQDISGITRAIFINYFSLRVANGRGCVLLQLGGEIQRGRGSFGGFSSPLTMHCNSFAAKGIIQSPIRSCSTRDHSIAAVLAANGIGQEGCDESAQKCDLPLPYLHL